MDKTHDDDDDDANDDRFSLLPRLSTLPVENSRS